MPVAGPPSQPSRRAFLAGLAGAVGAVGLAACSEPTGGRPVAVPVTENGGSDEHPNLVVIVSDDHRWDHVSYYPTTRHSCPRPTSIGLPTWVWSPTTRS